MVFGWLRKIRRPKDALPAKPSFLTRALLAGPGEELYRALSDYWVLSDSNATPAREHLAVDRIEKRYALSIPDDFKTYLLHAAPGQTYWDDIGTQWWSPSDIKNIPDECPDAISVTTDPEIEAERHYYLVFADYLIWCYAWAICCSPGKNRGRIVIIGGGDRFVADSFREFLSLELADDQSIHIG